MSMTTSGSAALADRSLDLLTGSDAILAEPATATGSLAGLGAILSTVEEAAAGTGSSPSGATETGPATAVDVASTIAGSAAEVLDGVRASDPAPVTAPVIGLANAAIIDTHVAIEAAGHEVPLSNGVVHALTNLGETVGLGHIGESGNLATTIAQLPTTVLGGNPSGAGLATALDPIPGQVGDSAGAAAGLVDQAVGLATTGLTGTTSPLGPVLQLGNDILGDTLHGVLATGSEVPALGGPAQALTTLGETIGLGHVGEPGNVITSVAELPAAVASGNVVDGLSPILGETGGVVGATGNLIDHLVGVASPGNGLVGSGGALDPVTGFANSIVGGIHGALDPIAGGTGAASGPGHALADLGRAVGLGHVGESGNLLTDTIAAPSEVLGGNGAGAVQAVLSDAGASLAAVGHLATGLEGGGQDANLVGTVTHALGGTPTLGDPIGGIADAAGTLSGMTGALTGSGGANPLISVEAGSQSATPIAAVNVLAPVDPAPHTIDIGIGAAPAGQPSAIQVGALSGDAISIPALGGHGLDGLVGQAALPVASATPLAPATAADPGHAPGLDASGLDLTHLTGSTGTAHGPLHCLI